MIYIVDIYMYVYTSYNMFPRTFEPSFNDFLTRKFITVLL